MKPKSKILIIAGSDSSGGAGIQADIKTVTALGSYAMTAITAVTSQNTLGVKSISSITPREILRQIEFTSKDIRPDAIKIGMLGNTKVINTVLKSISKIKINKIILDPVMVAKNGTRLIDNKSIKILKKKFLKKVSLITPNIPEAEILANQKINSKKDMVTAGKKLLDYGAKSVLVKGGHLKSKLTYDIFLDRLEDAKNLSDTEFSQMFGYSYIVPLKEQTEGKSKNEVIKMNNFLKKHENTYLTIMTITFTIFFAIMLINIITVGF